MALSKLAKRFLTDPNREELGTWVDFGEGIRVRVRRVSSKKSVEVRKELDRPFTDQIRRGPLPVPVAEDLLLLQMSRAIVSDWEGVELVDGEPLAFTEANVYLVLKTLPELRDSILQVSVDADNYRILVDADAEKNS